MQVKVAHTLAQLRHFTCSWSHACEACLLHLQVGDQAGQVRLGDLPAEHVSTGQQPGVVVQKRWQGWQGATPILRGWGV